MMNKEPKKNTLVEKLEKIGTSLDNRIDLIKAKENKSFLDKSIIFLSRIFLPEPTVYMLLGMIIALIIGIIAKRDILKMLLFGIVLGINITIIIDIVYYSDEQNKNN